jgi:hypothetical protein
VSFDRLPAGPVQGEGRGAHQVLGNPWGETYPPSPELPLPAVDPRTYALEVLRAYVAGLTFYRPGAAPGPGAGPSAQPVPFRVPPEQFHVEPPDAEQDLVFPSMVVTSQGEEKYDSPGLTSDVEEQSADVYGRGTVLQVQYEHQEEIVLEMWAASKPERRALLAGMQVSLSPTEQLYGLRLRMRGYYDQTVCFTALAASRRDQDAVRGRRVAAMRIEMRFNVVRLVSYERAKQAPVAVEASHTEDVEFLKEP